MPICPGTEESTPKSERTKGRRSAAAQEWRIDPENGEPRTLAELLDSCKEQYTAEEILEYWQAMQCCDGTEDGEGSDGQSEESSSPSLSPSETPPEGRAPCKWGPQCSFAVRDGRCRFWHPKEEWRELMRQHRAEKSEENDNSGGQDEPSGGPLPPELAADAKTAPRDFCRSIAEQIDHFPSRVDRVDNTVELSDYFGMPKSWQGANSAPCYSLGFSLDLSDSEMCKETESGLGPLLDKVLSANPAFAMITQLSELSEDNIEKREYQRPAGYSAYTRLHAGRLCVPVLNDTGATCSSITEEQLVLIVNHTSHMLEEGLIAMSDYNYPLVQFYRYKNVSHLKSAEKSGGMLVEYAVELRMEFIPEGSSSGPVKNIYFKVAKRGTCGIVGAVLGWPALDYPVVPGGEGLGWSNRPEGAEFSVLGVTVPRLDDQSRAHYAAAVACYRASLGYHTYTPGSDGVESKGTTLAGGQFLESAALGQTVTIGAAAGDRVQLIGEAGSVSSASGPSVGSQGAAQQRHGCPPAGPDPLMEASMTANALSRAGKESQWNAVSHSASAPEKVVAQECGRHVAQDDRKWTALLNCAAPGCEMQGRSPEQELWGLLKVLCRAAASSAHETWEHSKEVSCAEGLRGRLLCRCCPGVAHALGRQTMPNSDSACRTVLDKVATFEANCGTKVVQNEALGLSKSKPQLRLDPGPGAVENTTGAGLGAGTTLRSKWSGKSPNLVTFAVPVVPIPVTTTGTPMIGLEDSQAAVGKEEMLFQVDEQNVAEAILAQSDVACTAHDPAWRPNPRIPRSPGSKDPCDAAGPNEQASLPEPLAEKVAQSKASLPGLWSGATSVPERTPEPKVAHSKASEELLSGATLEPVGTPGLLSGATPEPVSTLELSPGAAPRRELHRKKKDGFARTCESGPGSQCVDLEPSPGAAAQGKEVSAKPSAVLSAAPPEGRRRDENRGCTTGRKTKDRERVGVCSRPERSAVSHSISAPEPSEVVARECGRCGKEEREEPERAGLKWQDWSGRGGDSSSWGDASWYDRSGARLDRLRAVQSHFGSATLSVARTGPLRGQIRPGSSERGSDSAAHVVDAIAELIVESLDPAPGHSSGEVSAEKRGATNEGVDVCQFGAARDAAAASLRVVDEDGRAVSFRSESLDGVCATSLCMGRSSGEAVDRKEQYFCSQSLDAAYARNLRMGRSGGRAVDGKEQYFSAQRLLNAAHAKAAKTREGRRLKSVSRSLSQELGGAVLSTAAENG